MNEKIIMPCGKQVLDIDGRLICPEKMNRQLLPDRQLCDIGVCPLKIDKDVRKNSIKRQIPENSD